MNEVTFKVQGSAAEPYEVTFKKADSNLTAHCSCPAGQVGQYCKHRLGILAGDTTGIVSDNSALVAEVRTWLAGTDVEVALAELRAAEQEYELAKKKVSICKKRVAHALMS